jgi:hypothetical protein
MIDEISDSRLNKEVFLLKSGKPAEVNRVSREYRGSVLHCDRKSNHDRLLKVTIIKYHCLEDDPTSQNLFEFEEHFRLLIEGIRRVNDKANLIFLSDLLNESQRYSNMLLRYRVRAINMSIRAYGFTKFHKGIPSSVFTDE